MMKCIEYPNRNDWPALIARPAADDPLLEPLVRKILLNVKKKGDAAVAKYQKAFDKKIATPKTTLDQQLVNAIDLAKRNIEKFHTAQKERRMLVQTMHGILCWTEPRPIEKIGLYIPGGTAPLFSTMLMLAIPAKIAGCREIVCCCPSDHPAISYTANLCGITKIHQVGGAQAIAAMSYGTQTIPKVDKIFGPGNRYTTMAKQLVQLEGVAIDMPAGPSELLIIADDEAEASYVAADLLSQAEHGEDSQVILLTTSRNLMFGVLRCLDEQLKDLPRQLLAKKALENSLIILVRSLDEAIELSNLYAPEHLILVCKNADALSKDITCAGSVFIGNYSPVAAGDYATGTNHTLPTNGYAASYSGITLESFQKKILFQKLTRKGLKEIAPAVMTMADAEGLEAHKKAIAIRL